MIKITGAGFDVKAASNRRLPGSMACAPSPSSGCSSTTPAWAWLSGGFLGVDLFFVISGFLITSLLLERSAAWPVTSRCAQFYLRRARRLLPALVVMLAVVAVFMAIFAAADLGQARGDIAAALGYVSNWWYVLHHRSYFIAAGRPSPFQHLWSLAVEEQFYLIWPAVLVALVATRARLRWVVAVALAGAFGSALWMRVLAVRGNVPFDTDSSRLYFGTDTHASALLLGAAAAAVMAGLATRLDRGIPVGRARRMRRRRCRCVGRGVLVDARIRLLPAGLVSRRLPCVRCRRRCRRGNSFGARRLARAGTRCAADAMDWRALVRPVSVALAGFRLHPPRSRLVVARSGGPCRQVGDRRVVDRTVVPVRRGPTATRRCRVAGSQGCDAAHLAGRGAGAVGRPRRRSRRWGDHVRLESHCPHPGPSSP